MTEERAVWGWCRIAGNLFANFCREAFENFELMDAVSRLACDYASFSAPAKLWFANLLMNTSTCVQERPKPAAALMDALIKVVDVGGDPETLRRATYGISSCLMVSDECRVWILSRYCRRLKKPRQWWQRSYALCRCDIRVVARAAIRPLSVAARDS
jgi:hypothetical protein